MTLQAWDKSFTVNVRGPLSLVQEALPYLQASTHAAVLNVISVGAFMFSPDVAMYSAGKSAMRGLADPEEMVGPALLLTSDAGSFITGQVLIADGGMFPH
jgi:NAD(P)-dependent dehydrogenase (short-subunit alcohol dehydrogenase family)